MHIYISMSISIHLIIYVSIYLLFYRSKHLINNILEAGNISTIDWTRRFTLFPMTEHSI